MPDSPQKQRVDAAYNLQSLKRPPALGGWIADPAKIMALTGADEETYWNDPMAVSVAAYRELGLDGLLDVNIPSERGGYTLVTENHMRDRARYDVEAVVAEIERLPEPAEVLARFDEEEAFRSRCEAMEQRQALCGDNLYWTPARWEVIPNFEWYRVYGYETYLLAICLYPGHILRLYQYDAARAACEARVVARMVREGRHPIAMLCGMDICGQQGPLVDPGFLREHYFPLVRPAIQPLLDVGARLIWHCDGDIRPILDDLLALGIGGLQGFQEECGVRLEDMVERRSLRGEKLIILGPISVTRTLVSETPAGVRRAVRDAIATCRDKASLVLFTSNEILPDVPLENMRAMYDVLTEFEP